MRSIGIGFCATAAERFCGLMNTPTIIRASPYAAHNKALMKAAKELSQETMHENPEKADGEVGDWYFLR